jgi:hypothetical protein
MNQRWLVMAKRWVQNPPSPARIKLIAGVIGICLLFYAFEAVWGWPAALTPHQMRGLQ